MNTRILIAALAVLTLGGPIHLVAEPGGSAPPIPARAAFDRIKSLAGEWRGAMTGDTKLPDAVVHYRVTSAGSAVEEIIGPGSPHEMVTMYHLDGDRLLLTHYCGAGNQPRMVLDRKRSTPDNLAFKFAGGTNFKSSKDGHMHALRLRFTGTDSIEAEWEFWKDGKKSGVEQFTLTRKR